MEIFVNPLVISILSAAAVAVAFEPAMKSWCDFSRLYFKSTLQEFKDVSYDLPALDFWLSVWGGAMLASLLAGVLAWKPLLGINGAFILFVIPKQVMLRLIDKRRETLKEQLVSGITLISNSVKTGLALEQAFALAGKEMPAPLGSEFKRVAYDCEHGLVFDSVLQDSKKRIRLQEYLVFVTAITTNKKRGGDVTKTLTEIRKSLLENQRLDRKMNADTSMGRFTINILAAFPVVFLGFSFFMNPTGTKCLFTEFYGNLALLVATLTVYVGYRWGQKIITVYF